LRSFVLIGFVATTVYGFGAHAAVIFDDFGQSPPAHCEPMSAFSQTCPGLTRGGGPGLGGPAAGAKLRRVIAASSFTPQGQTFGFDAATLALGINGEAVLVNGSQVVFQPALLGPQPLSVFLLDSAPNGAPANVLETTQQTITEVADRTFTFKSAEHPLLLAGHPYWIAVTAGTAPSLAEGPLVSGLWFTNSTGATGFVVQGLDLNHLAANFAVVYGLVGDNPEFLLPAFSVEGTPIGVPEPASGATLAAGLLGLAALRARTREQQSR
jgi:hypothetical protein